ncbi:MAG: hypothetical protein C4518_17285 [Desulfobacteraceae bacterium]|nr:MAG: hypothetical protein C4518_17285 [Desulfobacteraceae bacterium]
MEIPDGLTIKEKFFLVMVSVLFIAGCLIWFVFFCLKMPVKRFTRYFSDLFLLDSDLVINMD